MARLTDKIAVVTGAASGIGRASALLFAREGARVVIADRNAEGLAETARLADQAGRVHAVTADTGNETDVKALLAQTADVYGVPDIAFANAGVSGGTVPLFEQSVEHWLNILRVNLLGAFVMVKYAALAMTPKGRGSIILTASVAGLRASAGAAPYSASKAGVISLAQTAANSLSGTGVRVNAICPGLIETGMTRPLFDLARERGVTDRIGRLNPLQRAGQPEEIAAMALFLASDESSYVNGQAFAVDGGLSSTLPFTRPIR